ncbi:hypothetical protein ACFVVX_23095 [Kitasatospora sp. NPDC058170]
MRPGTAAFLVGTAFALLALAIATVILGVITALNTTRPDDDDPR